MSINFIVYQLQRVNGQEILEIPEVLVEHAAKTTHRHRKSDLFAIHLVLDGKHEFQGSEIQLLLHEASGIFFHTPGSVTRAMQLVIDYLNKFIYKKNADWGYEDLQAQGSINVAVLHNARLFIGQAGDGHVYRIGHEVYERYGEDGEETGKLGLSSKVHSRFYQCELIPGDMLLLSPKAHGSWKPYYLAGGNGLSDDQLKRRLHNQMIQDFSVLVIRTEEGQGRVHFEDWAEEPPEMTQKENSTVENEEIDILEQEEKQERAEVQSPAIVLPPSKILARKKQSEVEEKIDEFLGESDAIQISEGETENESSLEQERNDFYQTKKEESGKLIKSTAKLWMRGKTLRSKIQYFSAKVCRKIFPNRKSAETSINWRAIAVVTIPLFLTALSLIVYANYGKVEQYNIFMNGAREKAGFAEETENLVDKKIFLKEVMDLTLKAEEYQVTNESRQLFQKAQTYVDGVDLTSRLEFRPATTQPFPDSATIKRIKEGSSGIYLLDGNSGNVLRAYVNSKGFYELDDAFRCSPGSYGLVEMGEIVDFIVLPANSKGYKVMASDSEGNLLYCQPGEIPSSRTLTIPSGGWGEIKSLLYSEKWLYVIDPLKDNVWIYRTDSESENDLEGIVFVEAPISFFDEEVPDLGGAIGAVINQEDIYILHEDGHMTLCQYGHEDVRLTTCEDPAPFTDDRSSSENKKPWIFMGTNFLSIDHARLPNQSIYLLDGISGTLYRFSMQLNLENTLKPQINPNFPLPNSAPSGFGVTLNQEVLLAYGNQLFTAPLQ